MRITNNNDFDKDDRLNIDDIHSQFQQKWGTKVNKDVIKDLNSVLEDPECLKTPYDIWKETKKGYKRGEFEYIQKGFKRNVGMRRFLQRLSEHAYYQEILRQPNPLMTLADVLGNLIQKEQQQGSGGSGSGPDEEAQAFQDIVRSGKQLLDLLDDPTMQQYIQNSPDSGDGDDDDENTEQNDGEGKSEERENAPLNDKPQGFDNSKAVEKILKHWDAAQIHVMSLCQDLDLVMRLKKSGKESPTEFPEDGIDIRGMRSLGEVSRALPSQHALPSDIFYQRMARHELLIKEWTTKKERKNILYMLLDRSGSMGRMYSYYGIDKKSKLMWGCSVAISYLRNMVKKGDIFGFRFFESKVGPLFIAETPKEGGQLIDHIFKHAGDSGGTDIQCALNQAIHDISTKKDKRIEKADIMILTDGESHIDERKLQEDLTKHRIHLHTVVLGRSSYGGGVAVLKRVSKNFLQITNEAGYYKLASMMNKE